MRSKEVAHLAGVSVRTLRHYHQIGVLPEPERGGNGYRSYQLADVARLLRIRTLAELGIPLEQMPDLLDSPHPDSHDELLADLTGQLEQRIAHLQGQVRRLTELRSTRARPDLTPELVELLEEVGEVEPGAIAGVEEDASVLVAHLFETDGTHDELRKLGSVLSGVRGHEQYAAFMARFEGLAPDAPDSEIRELADHFMSTFGPAITQVIDSAMNGRLRRLRPQDVPAVGVDPRLNDAQAEALRLLGERL